MKGKKMKYITFIKKLENAGIINKPQKIFTKPELDTMHWAKKLGGRLKNLGELMELRAPDIIIEKAEELVKTGLEEFTEAMFLHKKFENEKILTVKGKDIDIAERIYKKYLRKKKSTAHDA